MPEEGCGSERGEGAWICIASLIAILLHTYKRGVEVCAARRAIHAASFVKQGVVAADALCGTAVWALLLEVRTLVVCGAATVA